MTTEAETFEPPTPHVYRLNAEELTLTQAKLAKINARATRRAFAGRWVLDATPVTWTETLEGGLPVTRTGFDVTLTGDAPCINGWSFLGAADRVVGTESTVIRLAPGAGVEVRNADIEPGRCDHCHTQRTRKTTILVRNTETGQLLQVGSTCVKDFLGWNASPVFLWEDDVERELDFATASSGSFDPSIESVLAYAVAAVELWGFKPSSFHESTANAVRDALSSGRPGVEMRRALAPKMVDALTLVPTVLATIAEAFSTAESGYEANLAAVAQPGAFVGRKSMGLAVSAVSAYHKLLGRKAEREAKLATPNEWISTPGEKVTVTGTIARLDTYDPYSYYGPSPLLVILNTPEGVVKNFTTASWATHVHRGETVTLTGTVKAHETYHDTKQTVLTRTKRAA